MAGGFYKGRCIYVTSSFILVLSKDYILELDMPNNFIGYKVREIVCCYILLLVSFSVYRY